MPKFNISTINPKPDWTGDRCIACSYDEPQHCTCEYQETEADYAELVTVLTLKEEAELIAFGEVIKRNNEYLASLGKEDDIPF
jgi:hypothetical protein